MGKRNSLFFKSALNTTSSSKLFWYKYLIRHIFLKNRTFWIVRMILVRRLSEYFWTLFFRIINHDGPKGVTDFSMNKSACWHLLNSVCSQPSTGAEILKNVLFHVLCIHINGFTLRMGIWTIWKKGAIYIESILMFHCYSFENSNHIHVCIEQCSRETAI